MKLQGCLAQSIARITCWGCDVKVVWMTVRQMQDRTCCATSSTLGSRRGGNEPSSSLLTMYPSSIGDYPAREGRLDLPASGREGARVRWYGEYMRILDKRRYVDQAKDADRLEPNRCMAVELSLPSAQSWTQRHRRKEGDLTHLVIQAEHGKPVVLPFAGRQPQGEPMGLRVWEEGKSECRVVMTRIGVAVKTNITPRESGQTSLWSLITREFE
jgi:hypothetical protein